MKFGRGAGLAIRMIHGARRRGRAVAASPPHLKDRGLRKSMKIKGGTNASENFRVVRFEKMGLRRNSALPRCLSMRLMASVQFRTFEGILTFTRDVFKNLDAP